jgi:hypothetical protein
MGCACLKSEVAVKNSKLKPKTDLRDKVVEPLRGSVSSNYEIRSNSNHRNRRENSNSFNQNNQRGIIRGGSSSQSNRQRSIPSRVNEEHFQIVSGGSMNSMPYLPSINDPNFNFPVIGKTLFYFRR